MKRVLIFANPYKPMDNIGVKRITKFLKYMDGSDWEPVVIAPKVKGSKDYDEKQPFKTFRLFIPGPSYLYYMAAKLFPRKSNRRQVNKKPGSAGAQNVSGASQSTARSASLNQWLFVPDEYILWGIYAVFKALRLSRKNKIDLCFASGPAHSTLYAGALFSKLSKTKFIADFRDPWIDNEFTDYKTNFHLRSNKRMENFVIKQASKVLTISPNMRELFLKRYTNLDTDKITVLYNGYDKADLTSIKEKEVIKEEVDRTVVVTHTGMFYGKRNPATFLKGLIIAKEKEPNIHFKVNFVGGIDKVYFDFAIDNDLDIVDVGRVPYTESVQYQQKSDILLLVPGPGKGTVTGKFFEYLLARKNILCIGIPDSDLDQLINYTDSGLLADAESPEDISEKLITLANDTLENKNQFKHVHADEFDFKHLTEELIGIFNQTIDSKYQGLLTEEEK